MIYSFFIQCEYVCVKVTHTYLYIKQCLIKVEIEHAFSIIINYNVHAEQSSVAFCEHEHTQSQTEMFIRKIHSLSLIYFT